MRPAHFLGLAAARLPQRAQQRKTDPSHTPTPYDDTSRRGALHVPRFRSGGACGCESRQLGSWHADECCTPARVHGPDLVSPVSAGRGRPSLLPKRALFAASIRAGSRRRSLHAVADPARPSRPVATGDRAARGAHGRRAALRGRAIDARRGGDPVRGSSSRAARAVPSRGFPSGFALGGTRAGPGGG